MRNRRKDRPAVFPTSTRPTHDYLIYYEYIDDDTYNDVTTRVLGPPIQFFLVSVCQRRRRRFPSGTCLSPISSGRSRAHRSNCCRRRRCCCFSVSTTSATVLKAQTTLTPTVPVRKLSKIAFPHAPGNVPHDLRVIQLYLFVFFFF